MKSLYHVPKKTPAGMIENIANENGELTRRAWSAATVAIVLLAVVVRFSLNFAGSFPPGVNAAYYPLQVHAWLTHGRLMYDDLPLIFWLYAGFSKLLIIFGVPIHQAALLASRILDSIIEPWAALGIMALGYSWSGGQRKALLGCIAATILALLSPPIMRMLSEFEKNSLGLVFMACSAWACRSAMMKRTPQAWLLLSALLTLAALTHLGAFAVTLTLVIGSLAMWCFLSLDRRVRAITLTGFTLVSVALVAVIAYFDRQRAGRLIRAPINLFRAGSIDMRPLPILVIAALLIILALGILWRDRRSLQTADLAIVPAAALTTLILVCPKSYVYFDRLFLMVPIPASILLVFIMARLHNAARWSGFALLLLSFFAAVAAPQAVQHPLMNKEVATELSRVQRLIPNAESTLVIAPHGLEWWAGYFLGTPVRSTIAGVSTSQYGRVLYLRNTVDCPPEVASPFPLPPIDPKAPLIYLGHYIEVYQVN
jgi:hypothetical protein